MSTSAYKTRGRGEKAEINLKQLLRWSKKFGSLSYPKFATVEGGIKRIILISDLQNDIDVPFIGSRQCTSRAAANARIGS